MFVLKYYYEGDSVFRHEEVKAYFSTRELADQFVLENDLPLDGCNFFDIEEVTIDETDHQFLEGIEAGYYVYQAEWSTYND